jgi:hypothetical protein
MLKHGCFGLVVFCLGACTIGDLPGSSRNNAFGGDTYGNASRGQVCNFSSCAPPYTCEDYDRDGVAHCAEPGRGGTNNGCTGPQSCASGWQCVQGVCQWPSSAPPSGGTCPEWTQSVSAFNAAASRMFSAYGKDGIGTIITVLDQLMNAGCGVSPAAQTCEMSLRRALEDDPTNRLLDCVECCQAITSAASISDPGIYFCQASCHYAGF